MYIVRKYKAYVPFYRSREHEGTGHSHKRRLASGGVQKNLF